MHVCIIIITLTMRALPCPVDTQPSAFILKSLIFYFTVCRIDVQNSFRDSVVYKNAFFPVLVVCQQFLNILVWQHQPTHVQLIVSPLVLVQAAARACCSNIKCYCFRLVIFTICYVKLQNVYATTLLQHCHTLKTHNIVFLSSI